MQLSRLSKFIFVSLLLCFSNAQANWWTKFVNMINNAFNTTTPTYYFGDPANPGINGRGGKSYTYSKALPPYNRKVGRGSTGREENCLYRYDIADDWKVDQWTCAQDPGNNSSTRNKIKVRNVVCFGGCWAETFELDALKGQCNFFSTKYLVTTKRVCARITSPPTDGYAADPGYMQGTDPVYGARGQHLDTYGVTQWDDLVADRTGAQYSILRPKICAYDDPWLLDLWTVADPSSYGSLITAVNNLISGSGDLSGFLNIPLDIFDMNPISQPFHGGSGVTSPIASILISLLQFYQSYISMGAQMQEVIISVLASAMGISAHGSKIMDTLFKVVNFILTYEVSTVLLILKANSQVNKYAYANYGCVNITLGDYPPNYCPTSGSIVTGLLDSICSTDSNGNPYQNCYGLASIQTGQTRPYTLCSPITCVQINYDNNFLNNTVRIGYTHPVQACGGAVVSNCVNISTSLTRASAMANNNFVLGSALSLIHVGNVTISPTKQYRVLYQVLNSSMTDVVQVSNYSYVDLPDCGGTTNGYTAPSSMGSVVQSTQFCQSIWGVDVGEYSDSFNIAVNATTTAPTGPLSTSSSPISIPYVDLYTGTSSSNKFYVQIDQQTEDYSHICAYQIFSGTSYPDTKVDCVDRVDIPTPTITSCSTSTHVSPCATITWNAKGKIGTLYTTSATMLIPQFTSDWSSLPADPVLYLGGASFTTHVVDSNNLTIPYQPTTSSDNRIVSYNGNVMYDSMWGNYVNSVMPSSSCDQDTCAIYLNGLEYISGHYVRGGAYLCIDNTKGCQNDTTQCILANNYTALDGTSTWTSISPSDRVVPSSTAATLSSSDYYTYDNVSTLPSNENVRSKIGLENSSMCVTVPPATCSASTDSATYYSDWSLGTPYYYMATWPASSVTGTLATGSCIANYVPVDSSKMKRYCFLQSTGTTVWDTDNSRISSTFSGCVKGCISNITMTPSNGSALTGGGNITVQNNPISTKSVDGGNLLIYSTGGVGSNGISGSGINTNTITVNFTLPYALTQADIYFTSLQFADYIQVYVNGTRITTDTATISYNGTDYTLWDYVTPTANVGGWRNYSTLDNNLSNLNAALLANLKSGSNTITINVKTVDGGGFYIAMAYNQLCYNQCSNDNAGFATWTQSAVGGISVGTCLSGYNALDTSKMSRYCALSGSSGVLDTVSTGTVWVSGNSSNSSKGTNFAGCTQQGCIQNISFPSGYPTQVNAEIGVNSSTNSTNADASGTISLDTATSARGGVWTVDSWKVNFDLIDVNSANIYFSKLTFWDGMRIKVNGTQITNDTASIGGVTVWGSVNAPRLYYKDLDPGFVLINNALKSNLRTGTNTIQVDLECWMGCSLEAILNYNASCMNNATCLNDAAGNATWTSANVGGYSTGTCNTNYVRVDTTKMSRLCSLNSDGKAQLEKVIHDTTVSGNFAGCALGNCAAVTTASSSTGNATWATADAGTSSAGTCGSGYIAVDSNKMSRTCSVSNDVASLETITNGVTASGNFAGCTSTTCINDNSGNASWSPVTIGNTSAGTCSSGYRAVDSAYMSRSCNFINGVVQLDFLTNNTSSNFYGCLPICISLSPTASATQVAVTGTNTATVTPNSNGNGGTIVFASPGMTASTVVANLNAGQNTFTATFNIPTGMSLSQAGVYFTDLRYNDQIRVSVNGTQITTDTNTINGFVLWSLSTTAITQNLDYQTLDPNFINLNAAIQSHLQIGTNTITVTVKTNTGTAAGYLYAALKYNTTCYPQCTADTIADVTSGYATWTAAPVGAVAKGTCGSGYSPVSTDMYRTCNYVSGVSQLDTLSSNNTSTNFDGCVTNCISATPTTSGTVPGTVTPNSSGTGGTIAFYKSPLVAGTGNTATVSFNIPTSVPLSQVSMYFTTLQYNDYIRVSVNGIQITNDNATLNGYVLWSITAGDCLVAQDYSTLDPGLSNLNAAILSNLQYGANTITVTLRAYGSTTAGFTGNLAYNLGCACTEDITPDATSGYAKWTRSVITGTSTGTCTTGFTTINSSKMTRTCNLANNLAQLDTLTNGTSTNFGGCGCAAVTTASSATGNATWTAAAAGGVSTGTCATGYSPANSSKMTRSCTVSNNLPVLETISNGTTASGNFAGCVQNPCTNDNAGNATWTTANVGSLSTGTCNSGYSPVGSMTRACTSVGGVGTLDTVTNGISSNTSPAASFQGCHTATCPASGNWPSVSYGSMSNPSPNTAGYCGNGCVLKTLPARQCGFYSGTTQLNPTYTTGCMQIC